MLLGLEFPPISHAIEWQDLFGSGAFAVNKVVLLMWASVLVCGVFFFVAAGAALHGCGLRGADRDSLRAGRLAAAARAAPGTLPRRPRDRRARTRELRG